MNKERLLRLADFLETTVSEEQFSLHTWMSGNVGECGTVACACGWATQIPEFAEAGLKIEPRQFANTIVYGGHAGFSAAMLFFDLDYNESEYLFDSVRYPRVSMNKPVGIHCVISRIRIFVETGKVLT